MRVIEKEMLSAVERNLICNGGHWAKDNTSVFRRGRQGVDVFLHGHHIAHVKSDGVVEVNKETLARWPTNTTKSRLRALGVNVYTKNHVTYLDGEAV